MRQTAFLALAAVLLIASLGQAVITKLTHLAEVLETEDYIFVAGVERVDPEKPAALFKLEKQLKGQAPFERLAVNMTGNAEAQKAGDTKTILDRLHPSRKLVLFVSQRGKKYNAMAFVEGSWFSLQGTIDEKDKTVRWAFQNGEPFLRRTFKGTTAELVQVIADGLANKAKPPMADEKEKPGYGPPVEKKCDEPAGRPHDENSTPRPGQPGRGATSRSPTLFAVIPSTILIGPLALVAALFPGVFARLAVGMKRWRAFLVVASINSTLALVYYFTQHWLPGGWWFGPQAFTIALLGITAVGLSWAGRRYRRMAAEQPAVTAPPTNLELYSLGGLTAFAALCVGLTAAFSSWGTNLELPLREFTFIGIALAVAGLYAAYRRLTARVDLDGTGTPPDRRLSISGETVGLATLFLCGLVVVLSSGRSTGPLASGTELGDADAIGPRLVDVTVFEIPKSSQVLSGISIAGDRLYFGTQYIRTRQEGHLVCMDRHTGEVKWKFGDDDELMPVFCTPTIVGDRIYCGEGLHENTRCRLFCLTLDGQPAWPQPIQVQSHTEGAPAVVGNTVLFPAGDDGLFAVDAATGKQLWQFPGGKDRGIHIDAAPAVRGNRVYVGSGLYSFVAVCLDTNTGQELWRRDLKLRAFGAPLVLGRFVYYGVGTGNMGADTFNYPEEGSEKEKLDQPAGAVVCLDAETGQEVWRAELPRSAHPGLAGDAFSVYAASRDGYLYAFDRTTGKLRWRTGIGGAITSSPAVATSGGMPVAVYAVSREGLAVCLNPHTGRVVWDRQLPGFHWDGQEANGVLSGPSVVTTATPTGSTRTIYIGAMTVDPANPARKTAAVFRLQDELGGADG
jgi:outer membrane protein assembly factor BamB